MYFQVAMGCFPKMLLSLPTYIHFPSFLISSANENSLIQERMKSKNETVMNYEMGYDRGGFIEGQEGRETPGPHTITNGSKLC